MEIQMELWALLNSQNCTLDNGDSFCHLCFVAKAAGLEASIKIWWKRFSRGECLFLILPNHPDLALDFFFFLGQLQGWWVGVSRDRIRQTAMLETTGMICASVVAGCVCSYSVAKDDVFLAHRGASNFYLLWGRKSSDLVYASSKSSFL